MVSKDAAKNKYYEGAVYGGEGKTNLNGVQPYEYMGVHKSGPNPKLTPAVGYTSQRDGAEEPGFNLLSKGYAGPQRLDQMNAFNHNLGVRNPDDLEHSK
jgi:hypothetical protein